MDPNGTTWEELQKQLFSEKEIKESQKGKGIDTEEVIGESGRQN